jgi:hypothetical protein
MKTALLSIVFLLIVAATGYSQDILLATIESDARLWSQHTTEPITWDYDEWDDYLGMKTTTLLFGNFNISDNGKTFSVNSSTPNFNLFANKLTDGLDQLNIGISTEAGGEGHLDSVWLQKSAPSIYPDLYGYRIDRVDLNIHMTYPFNYSPTMTFSLYQTPEPATLLLLGLGAVLLRKRK